MVIEDQSAVIAFLSSPSAHGGAAVDRIETHASIVFLAGARAWKLKRAVRYDYLDFSTVERRRAMCEAELRLNRRTAPLLYRRVAPVTREADGTLTIDGPGAPVDWVVEMERFDQPDLLDQRAAAGRLDRALMPPLGRAIAAFHAAADRRSDHGGYAGMAWVVEGNAAGYDEFGRGLLDPGACARLTRLARGEVSRHAHLLDARRDDGFVRQCHGDLHLRNIVLVNGVPTLFDAIEFNDELACIDVLYDLAFLLMDLWQRGLPRHANAAWNAYLADSGDLGGVALMPLFLSCRAAVRAKTSVTAARLQEGPAAAAAADRARAYLRMAEDLLRPAPPRLLAFGGFSGSGKSTLAAAIAPSVGRVPGAVVLRSDEIRKRLCGVPALQRLDAHGYTGEVSARVYSTLAEHAAAIVRAGHGAIVDAVYARPADRSAIERVAADAGVPFVGLWLDAPAPTLIARTMDRQHDPSDADAAVVRAQLAQGSGPVAWERLDAGTAIETVTADAMRILADRHLAAAAPESEGFRTGTNDPSDPSPDLDR